MSVIEGITEAMASEISQSEPSPLLSSQTSSTTSTESKSTRGQSLTQAINTASKPYHTHLNRTILARLPLALPPQNADPTAYAIGVRHLLPIYHAFETAWAKYVSVEPKTPTMEDFSMEEAVMLSVLIHLNLPQLARADRLKQDIALLLGVGYGELDSWTMNAAQDEDIQSTYTLGEAKQEEDRKQRLEASGTVEEEDGEGEVEEEDLEALDRGALLEEDGFANPALVDFVRRIKIVTEERPHVLIAYGWVLYMALFNGGRWIRAQLSKARTLWKIVSVSADQGSSALAERDEIGLSFWHFEGAHDGEDLKDEFKARMKDIEPMLSDQQREDIIEESIVIFKAISSLIDELDTMLANIDGDAEEEQQPATQSNRAAAPEDTDDNAIMVRSHMLRPRWETPLGYLELLFQILLPVGLWQLFMLLTTFLQASTVHYPMLRWNWGDGPVISQGS